VGGNAAGFSSLSPVAVPLWVKPQHIARGPAGGCGDDGAEVGLLDQRVEVDAPDEVIEVLQAATTIYAAGCRTGHRGARSTAADDARLQQRWAAANPLAGISATCLNAGQQQNRPGHRLSQAAMAEALDNGSAQPLSTALPDHICWAGTWWRPGAGGWTRVTEAGLVARLRAWAAQLTEPDTHGSGRQPGRAAPGGDADQHTDGPPPGESTPGGSCDGQE
jgi:hypothetical protein